MKKEDKKLNVELVEWVDITHQQGQPLNTRVELLHYITVGVVIYEDDKLIEIQDTWASDDNMLDERDRFASSVLAVPRGCIIDRIKFHREDSVGQLKEDK